MKRQLALFVAASMAFTALPAMSASAWTTNSLTSTNVITAQTALYEPGSLANTVTSLMDAVPGSVGNDASVDYTKPGGYLVITPQTSLNAGSIFKVNLYGAKWNFRSTQFNSFIYGQVPLYNAGYNGITSTLDSQVVLPANPAMYGAWQNNYAGSFAYTDTAAIGSASVGTTYDPRRGAWIATARYAGIGGNYFRFMQGADRVQSNNYYPTRMEIPYMLTVDPAMPTDATITVLGADLVSAANLASATSLGGKGGNGSLPAYTTTSGPSGEVITTYNGGDWDIVIPLSVLADDSGNPVNVSISDSNAGVTGQTIAYAVVSTAATNTTVTNSTNTASSEFPLDAIRVAETQAGSLKSGTFYINAPYGFHWDLSNASVVGDAIFSSANPGFNASGGNPLIYGPGIVNGKQTVVHVASGMWGLGLGLDGDGDNDSQMLVTLALSQRTVIGCGAISIVGAVLRADDDVPYNYAINLTVHNMDAGVTDQTVLAGTRVNPVLTTITSRTTITAKTALYEPGSLSSTATSISAVPGSVNNDADVDYAKSGSYLILTPSSDRLYAGSSFKVSLSGANWNFRSTQGNYYVGHLIGTLFTASYAKGGTPVVTGTAPLPSTPGTNTSLQYNYGNSFAYTGTDAGHADVGTTFDPARGAWEVTAKSIGIGGNYYRFLQKADRVSAVYGDPVRLEIPYELSVDPAHPAEATVTILASTATSLAILGITSADMPAFGTDSSINSKIISYNGGGWDLAIPLSVLADNSGNPVDVSIQDVSFGAPNQTIAYATVTAAGTITTVTNSANISRDTFPLDAIRIDEIMAGSLKSGTFYINAPAGFHWDLSNASIIGDVIFSSANPGFNASSFNPIIHGSGIINGMTTMVQVVNGMWGLGLGLNGNGIDDSKMLVTLNTPWITMSAPGSISIVGAVLYADSSVPFDYAINLNVVNVGAGVTSQSGVLAGKREDYSISLTADASVPTLISGRYDVTSTGGKGVNYNAYHKAARVTFAEIVPLSWWGSRETDFTLPEGVKFMEVKFPKLDKLSQYFSASNGNTDLLTVGSDGINNFVYFNYNNSKAPVRSPSIGNGNAGNSQSFTNVQLNGNKLKIFSVKVDDNAKATMQIDSWLSVDVGFSGDIIMSCTGSAINPPSCKIATAVSPLTMTTSVTVTKVGLQYIPTQDVTITENVPGALLQKGKVNMPVAMDPWNNVLPDSGDSMYFPSGVKYSSTPAPSAGGIVLEDSSGYLFSVKAPSLVPSTITLSGIVAYIGRSIPESSQGPYAFALTGDAFVRNSEETIANSDGSGNTAVAGASYGTTGPGPGLGTDTCDQFATRFLKVPYISITSENDLDAQSVAADKAALTWDVIKGANTAQTAVTSNLILPTSGANGSVITWASSDLAVVSASGAVTRPAAGTGDKTVTLTATITKGNASDTKTFELTVPAPSSSTGSTSSGGGGGGGGGGATYYAVSFVTNGGSSITPVSALANGKAAKPADPVKKGYVFAGWYTDSALTKAYDFNAAVTASFTLYAKWTEAVEAPEVPVPKSDAPEVPGRPENPFKDVLDTDWFYGDVTYVYANALMTGTSADKFDPDMPLTRGMLVTVLYRLAGSPDAAGLDNPFGDVADNTYYTAAVKWAAANAIVKGYGGGIFGPGNLITREQMAAVLYRYEQFLGKSLDLAQTGRQFKDYDAVSAYAKEAVAALTAQGIINGRPGDMFDPAGKATRSEVAAVLHRFAEAIK